MSRGPWTYGRRSTSRLLTCHPDLRRVLYRVILHLDVTILCGSRTEAEQESAFRGGTTTLHFPESKHNVKPGRLYSDAVDLAPYDAEIPGGVDWADVAGFERMADLVLACSDGEGVPLRWGGDWDMGGDRNPDGALEDLPHFERLRPFRAVSP